MPPSGYPQRDARAIAAFLSSCFEALESENTVAARQPAEGLEREIAGIDSVLTKHANEPFALHTLLLTREFYSRLLSCHPKTPAELRAVLPGVLADVENQITGVHVEEIFLTPSE